jgi:hypothetical protein
MWLFKNSIDTQGKLRLNLHSLSVLLEYRRQGDVLTQVAMQNIKLMFLSKPTHIHPPNGNTVVKCEVHARECNMVGKEPK